MEILLLSGYRAEDPLGLDRTDAGDTLLDSRIAQLKAMNLDPIVVLAGAFADDHIRHSRLLESCELVFDVSEGASLFSNLRAGLKAATQATFVLPVEVPVPPEHVFRDLKMQLLKEGFLTSYHLFQRSPAECVWESSFPLLVSDVGRKILSAMENPSGFRDERVRYFHV